MANDSSPKLSKEAAKLEVRAAEFQRRVASVFAALEQSFIGSRESLIVPLVHACLAGCHVLLEGAPGLGKTLLARALAATLGGTFSRIQCTPDLMPSDVTGTEILEDGDGTGLSFRFRKGPIFGNLVLADEINRATPKTQSAMLEAMEEQSVTAGGQTHALPAPFNLIGTQNPIEFEGTYPLPEAQLDRFALHLEVPYPDTATVARILDLKAGYDIELPAPCMSPSQVLELQGLASEVLVGPHLLAWLAQLLEATQPGSSAASDLVRLGASPRAGIAMLRIARVRALLDGRFHVSREDLVDLALPALRHRVLMTYEARARGLGVTDLIRKLVASSYDS